MNIARLLLFCLLFSSSAHAAVHAYFSPKGGVKEAILKEIYRTDKSIYIQAYSFTSRDISNALIEVHQNLGVEVIIVLDRMHEKHNEIAMKFKMAGIPVFIDRQHQNAHNKIMILDHKRIWTGSPNFTEAAESHNAENGLLLDGIEARQVMYQYLENFRLHKTHSIQY